MANGRMKAKIKLEPGTKTVERFNPTVEAALDDLLAFRKRLAGRTWTVHERQVTIDDFGAGTLSVTASGEVMTSLIGDDDGKGQPGDGTWEVKTETWRYVGGWRSDG